MSITELIAALFTSSGPGGVVVIVVIGLAATIYFWLTRWILQGGEEEMKDVVSGRSIKHTQHTRRI